MTLIAMTGILWLSVPGVAQLQKELPPQDNTKATIIGSFTKNFKLSISAPSEYCVVSPDYFKQGGKNIKGELHKGFDYRIDDYNLFLKEGVDGKKLAKTPIVIINTPTATLGIRG